MKKRYCIYIILFLALLIPFNIVKAVDRSNSFIIEEVKFCGDRECTTEYNKDNPVTDKTKFLIKLKWHIADGVEIQAGDTVEIGFANDKEGTGQTSVSGGTFAYTDFKNSDSITIGKWSVSGEKENKKLKIEFTTDVSGNVSGVFYTPKTIHTNYSSEDIITSLTIGTNDNYEGNENDKNKHKIKIRTYDLTEASDGPTVFYASPTNSSFEIRTISPKKTIKQLYAAGGNINIDDIYSIRKLWFELSLGSEIELKEINNISIQALYAYPIIISSDNLNTYKVSDQFARLNMTSFFTKIEQEDGETEEHFKARVNKNKLQYGIYCDDNICNKNHNKKLVINYGELPEEKTYNDVIDQMKSTNLIPSDFSGNSPGDYSNYLHPFTIDDNVKDTINSLVGKNNGLNGSIVAFGLNAKLIFDQVNVTTDKPLRGIWHWEDETGKTYEKDIDPDAKLVVPGSDIEVAGASKLFLIDADSKNEIEGVNVVLQKKDNGEFKDVEANDGIFCSYNSVTDSSGMIKCTGLKNGTTYRYVMRDYPEHYETDSFKMYANENLGTVITNFTCDSSKMNITYGTIAREKYKITYKKGSHGAFTDQEYSVPYGDFTPEYEGITEGEDNWIFDGWNPDPAYEPYVYRNQEYIATWYKTVNVITRYLDIETGNEISSEILDTDANGTPYDTIQKEIDNYEFVEVDVEPSGIRGEEDIVVTYYYKKKEANLNIDFLDCSTNQQITSISNTVYYGDEYDADEYEVYVQIPANYNRPAANKSDNYRGIVDNDEINVSYCYNKKDSQINSEIIKSGTDRITSSKDKVSYKIDYNTTFTDYIGDASILLVDKLPYKIDVANSNIDGGVYDPNSNTISWNVDFSIDSYNSPMYSLTKNIEVSYIDVDLTEDIFTNNVVGTTIISDKNTLVETNYNTYIDVKGTISVKYIESITNKELFDSNTTTDKVGKDYEIEEKNIEGYKIIDKPKNNSYKYQEGNQLLEFVYERIKFKIITSSGEGGKITGDEEVFYGEDSKEDNIKVEASDGYYISSVNINEKEIVIPEKQTKLTIPRFKNMNEDKYITVSFEKYSDTVNVPNTLKNSILKYIGFAVLVSGISILIYLFYKGRLKLIK